MMGELYITNYEEFTEVVKKNRGEVQIPENLSQILVYKSTSGRTGLDSDPAGEALAIKLLVGSFLCSTKGEVVAFKEPHNGFDLSVIPFLGKGGDNPVTFAYPDYYLNEEFEKFEEYFKQKKLNSLREKYSKSVSLQNKPDVLQVVCRDVNLIYISLFAYKDHCRHVALWPSFNNEFGMHVIITSSNYSRCMEDLAVWSKKYNCEIIRVEDKSKLPVW